MSCVLQTKLSVQCNIPVRHGMFKHGVIGRALPDQLIGCCNTLRSLLLFFLIPFHISRFSRFDSMHCNADCRHVYTGKVNECVCIRVHPERALPANFSTTSAILHCSTVMSHFWKTALLFAYALLIVMWNGA